MVLLWAMKKITLNRTTAVDRAIDIIELLSDQQKALSLSQLMKTLAIPKQSLIRILNTLCIRGTINKGEQRKSGVARRCAENSSHL